jgi:RNA polymerase-binding transcription factor DksA
MNSKKRRYIQTKFIQFIAEKNRLQDEDEVQDEIQDEEDENLEDEVQDEEDDLLTEIMRDLKKLERRK